MEPNGREPRTVRAEVLTGALLAVVWSIAVPAYAGPKYQTTLVPLQAGTMPGFSASGSSFTLTPSGYKGKIKGVVDGTGMRVTTNPADPADKYKFVLELEVPARGAFIFTAGEFDLKKGNGTFAGSLHFDPPIVSGDGVAVNALRLRDPSTRTSAATAWSSPSPPERVE